MTDIAVVNLLNQQADVGKQTKRNMNRIFKEKNMEVIDIQAVRDCLAEVGDCEDKQYAIALLEWAIGKRTFDIDEHDAELLKAKEEVINQLKWERDVAIAQLEEIGASFGLDMKLWLTEHDSDLLDKVAEKLKANIEKDWYRSELDMSADNVNCLIDEIIAELKAEVQNEKS